jgi:hypothetical protein
MKIKVERFQSGNAVHFRDLKTRKLVGSVVKDLSKDQILFKSDCSEVCTYDVDVEANGKITFTPTQIESP